jgi:hypothetical protein
VLVEHKKITPLAARHYQGAGLDEGHSTSKDDFWVRPGALDIPAEAGFARLIVDFYMANRAGRVEYGQRIVVYYSRSGNTKEMGDYVGNE